MYARILPSIIIYPIQLLYGQMSIYESMQEQFNDMYSIILYGRYNVAALTLSMLVNVC